MTTETVTVKVHPDADPLPSFEQQAWLVYGDGFCPDGGYIDTAEVDQWWRVYVACDHGKWSGTSNGSIDLGRGLQRAIAAAATGHGAVS